MVFKRVIFSVLFCVIIFINLSINCIMYNKEDNTSKESIAVELETNKYLSDKEN